ncbi:MAG: hypothetical protein LH660_08595, partial [Phormidesmis sp. CAN_BIN36]|nr:hypothetical protein [Phormidesmis sp. CAN_BIN36]
LSDCAPSFAFWEQIGRSKKLHAITNLDKTTPRLAAVQHFVRQIESRSWETLGYKCTRYNLPLKG